MGRTQPVRYPSKRKQKRLLYTQKGEQISDSETHKDDNNNNNEEKDFGAHQYVVTKPRANDFPRRTYKKPRHNKVSRKKLMKSNRSSY